MTEGYWAGKKVCFLGDSITEGVGTEVGHRYFDILAQRLNFEAVGYGVNGARFCDLMQQAEQMAAEQGDAVDAVFILAGTNDFYGCSPLGTWYTEQVREFPSRTDEAGTPLFYERRRMRTFSKEADTLKGSINRLMSFLKHRYAHRQIVLMTPLHRAYACFAPDNIQSDEMYTNSVGLYFDDYVQAVREASDIWSAELIDLHRCSGLFPLYDECAGRYFPAGCSDRLHPNAEGHRRLAAVLERKLGAIPLFD